jgi:UDP-glucuronate 4-epimerase
MAYFKVLISLLSDEEFTLFGDGSTIRDFTYIDDVVGAVKELDAELHNHKPGFSDLVNIAGGKPSSMSEMINEIEKVSGKKLKLKYEKFNSLDVTQTNSNTEYLDSLIGHVPNVSLNSGLEQFYNWATSPSISPKINNWKFY